MVVARGVLVEWGRPLCYCVWVDCGVVTDAIHTVLQGLDNSNETV